LYDFDGNAGFVLLSKLFDAVAIIIAVTVFEFIKAFVSTKFGDSRPRQEGRLTLNPLKHFEPVGFILFLVFGYGWGKPVECSSMEYSFKGNRDMKSRRTCTVIVNLAPMVVSIILACVLYLLSTLLSFATDSVVYLTMVLLALSDKFMSLALFNIIPVYPMCASRILKAVLPPDTALKFSQSEKVLQALVIFALLIGWLAVPLDFIKTEFYTILANFL
jgi:Zn-dependent protease